MGSVSTLLAPGQEHREDPCPEIFLGGISEILDKDWGHHNQSVSQDCAPLVKDAQESYFSGDTCHSQDIGEKSYFSRIILFYFFPLHLPASLSIYFSCCPHWFPKKRSLSPIFATHCFLIVANPWDQF